ncbi:MAG: effector-associated domain EAD1-containing protein [Myxococcota bacterium]
MQLDDSTTRELAAFFAKRFPAAGDRARLAGRVGLAAPADTGDAVEAWRALIVAAEGAGKLRAIAAAARAEAPGDANLSEVERILAPRGRKGVALALVVVGIVGVGGVAFWAAPEPTEDVAATAAEPTAYAAPSPAEPTASVAPAPTAPTADVAPPPPTTAAPPPAPPPTPSAPAEARSPKPEARSGCSAPSGTLVGYWYAGTDKPGELGQTITVRRGARVRADYPRAENGHRVDFPVRCALLAGMVVRLSRAPIETSGHWWVPLSGGDVEGG